VSENPGLVGTAMTPIDAIARSVIAYRSGSLQSLSFPFLEWQKNSN
jgi:hypothetical protein